MKIKRRKKSTRYRGSSTHRRGHKKRTRGLGNNAGKGMSGAFDQKKSTILHYFGKDYFGTDKALRRGRVAPKPEAINLSKIEENFETFKKKGLAKESKGMIELNLKGYKVLGEGELKSKFAITASAASESAIAKAKKSGSSINVIKKQEAEPIKKEKAEDKAKIA